MDAKNLLEKPKKLLTLPQIFANMPRSEKAGWIGMLCIHGATLPITVSNIMGWSDKLPPLSMVSLVWFGLLLYLWRAIATNDKLHIVSNSIGFALNSLLLALMFLPRY